MLPPPKRSLLLASPITLPLIFVALWKLPQLQVAPLQERMKTIANTEKLADLEKERIVAENNIRTGMIQGIGGMLVAITAYVGYLNYRALLEKNAADRFSKAVEQLGNDNVHVRLGGIYALEQIAKDAEEKYYWQVMETLTAYVREKSPAPNEITDPTTAPPLATDIQAVLTILARCNSSNKLTQIQYLNLRGTDLRRLQLPSNVNLSGVDFSNSNLQGALFREACLNDTQFIEADLRESWFIEVQLQKANFLLAKLQKARFHEANLSEAKLSSAHLVKTHFVKTDLREAELAGIEAYEASFIESDLRGAKLLAAELQYALFQGAKLQDAQFCEANLEGAILKKDKYFPDAIGLMQKQVEQAKNWQKAELPDYLLQSLPVEKAEAEIGEQGLEQQT